MSDRCSGLRGGLWTRGHLVCGARGRGTSRGRAARTRLRSGLDALGFRRGRRLGQYAWGLGLRLCGCACRRLGLRGRRRRHFARRLRLRSPGRPRPRNGSAFRLRASPLRWSSLRNGTEDNLNLNFVQIAITEFNDLVKAFVRNVRLGLPKGQVVTLDYGSADRPFPQPIALDAGLQGNVKKEDHRRNLKPLGQFHELPAVGRGERRGIHYAEAVQPQSQFRQAADQRERLGVESLVPLVVAHPASRPVRRDDVRGAKVALRKSRLAAGSRSAKQNDRRADQPYPFFLALIGCWFLCHSSYRGSFRDVLICSYSRRTQRPEGLKATNLLPSKIKIPDAWEWLLLGLSASGLLFRDHAPRPTEHSCCSRATRSSAR